MKDLGLTSSEPEWLAERIAAEIVFDGPLERRMLAQKIQGLVGRLPLDVAIQDAQNRKRDILIADMDSTIIQCECIDEIATFVGKKSEVSDITERAMLGELDFDAALRERVRMLQGLDVAVLEDVFAERIQLTEGATELVSTMNRNGATTALVSGGFTFFTERVATAVGFEMHRGNELEILDGKLSGNVIDPILGRKAKLQTLEDVMRRKGIPQNQTLAVGDGANDLDMINFAGLGVSYHGKPIVAEQADVDIANGDLTALLYLQGYRAAQFRRP
jgi:phosphoserine phosphatase